MWLLPGYAPRLSPIRVIQSFFKQCETRGGCYAQTGNRTAIMKLSNYLPKTLFGRMLSIILVPMILVQVITVFIFYERHWDTVTRHMATQLAADISLLADRTGSSPDAATIEMVQETGWSYFNFPIQFDEGAVWQQPVVGPPQSYAEERLRKELSDRLEGEWIINLDSDPSLIYVDLQLDTGVMRIYASRKRIFSSTSWTFFGWINTEWK